MKTRRFFGPTLVLALLVVLSEVAAVPTSATYPDPNEQAHKPERPADVPTTSTAQSGAASRPIIVDHTCTDITAIPQAWIEEAKRTLHIGYGHTSHGGQLTSGMAGLVAFANGGGLGLSLPENIFQFSETLS